LLLLHSLAGFGEIEQRQLLRGMAYCGHDEIENTIGLRRESKFWAHQQAMF
jgi:hypothetical protein